MQEGSALAGDSAGVAVAYLPGIDFRPIRPTTSTI